MKNKQHEYILKALTNSRFPRMLHEYLSNMMLVFEKNDFQSQDVLKGKKANRPTHGFIPKEIKEIISQQLNNQKIDIEIRNEMIFFYRLTILAVEVIELYCNS